MTVFKTNQPVTQADSVVKVEATRAAPLPVGTNRFRLVVVDDQGNQSTAPPIRIDLSSPRPPSETGTVRYETRIFLRGHTSHVVAALYDPVSGEVAAGRVDLREP